MILAELLGLSWEAWQDRVREAEELLARYTGEDEPWHDERWREIRWMLRYRSRWDTQKEEMRAKRSSG